MGNNKNFEEMMKDLEQIAKDLESGNLSLDESVKKFYLVDDGVAGWVFRWIC